MRQPGARIISIFTLGRLHLSPANTQLRLHRVKHRLQAGQVGIDNIFRYLLQVGEQIRGVCRHIGEEFV